MYGLGPFTFGVLGHIFHPLPSIPFRKNKNDIFLLRFQVHRSLKFRVQGLGPFKV